MISRFWRAFRFSALAIIVPFLITVLVITISYYKDRHTILVDGQPRHYHLHVPSSYDETQPIPLLLVFHMRQGTAWLMQEITRFNRLADMENFIVVYPDGYQRSWADGSQRYEADGAGIDDVKFVSSLLTELSEGYTLDEARIYVAGFSNGGFLAHRLGCELSEQLAAIATVSAVFPVDIMEACDPKKGMPVLMMHGTQDLDLVWGGVPSALASVPETVQTWLRINQCEANPAVSTFDNQNDGARIIREAYLACANQAEVIFYTIEGGGHTWPGGQPLWQFWLSGNRSTEIDASQQIWEFFAGHSK